MSAQPNRKRRDDLSPTALVQVRVNPEVRSELYDAAAASGVSVSYYFEALMNRIVRENGALPVVDYDRPRTHQQELPIQMAS